MSDHLDDVQLSRLIDGNLSLTAREAAVRHLRCCPGCAGRHDSLVAVAASLRMQPPVEWTPADTAAVLGHLPDRRHNRFKVALAGIGSLLMCGVVLFEAAPLLLTCLALAGVMLEAAAAVLPAGGSGTQLLMVVTAIAVLAPLAAYPLARWR